MQDDLGRATPTSGHPSRTPSRNTFGENVDTFGMGEADMSQLQQDLASADNIRTSTKVLSSCSGQHGGPPASYSYAAVLGASLSRSTTPDPQHIARAPSPCPTPIGGGRVGTSEKRGINSSSFNGVTSNISEPADLVDALSGMSLLNSVMDEENHLPSQIEQIVDHENYLFNMPESHNNINQHSYLKNPDPGQLNVPSPRPTKLTYSNLDMGRGDGYGYNGSSNQSDLHRIAANGAYQKGSSNSILTGGGGSFGSHYQHSDGTNSSFPNYGASGYPINSPMQSMMLSHLGSSNMPPLFENAAAASAMAMPGMDSRMMGGSFPSESHPNYAALESQHLGRTGHHIVDSSFQAPFADPLYLQYAAAQAALNDPSVDRTYLNNSYVDLLQKAYIGSLLSPQKSQYGIQPGSTGVSGHHAYYGNQAYGVGLSYPGSPLASPGLSHSPVGPGSPIRHGDLNKRFPSGMRNLAGGGVMGPWHLDASNMENNFASSLLEEFKINKTRCFELLEITGHVVEFR